MAQRALKEHLFDALRQKGWKEKDIEEAFLEVSEGDSIRGKLADLEAILERQDRRIERLEEQIGGAAKEEAPSVLVAPEPAAVPPPPPPIQAKLGAEGTGALPGKTPEEKQEKIDWESMLGGNWLVKIGVAALVLGTGFFFKLAFDNEWIGERGRIILGLIGGFSLLGLGEYWQKKYPVYAQILTGGGVAILYFTIYAAHAFYALVSSYAAFGFMALVTLVAGALAIRYGTPTIAVIGMIGGFFTPFMFLKAVDVTTLIIYTLVLDMGILVLSSVRNWRPLTLIGLVGSFLLFSYWYTQFYSPEKLWIAEGFLGALFLIFAFATILWHFVWNRRAEPADLALMTLNAAGFYAMSFFLLRENYGAWLGFFTFALAAFFAALAYAAFARSDKDPRLTLFLGGVSLVFLTIAMPVQLDKHWITIAWAAEGALLVWLGFQLASRNLRVGGLLAFMLAGFRLLLVDAHIVPKGDFTPFFNDRFLTFAMSVLALFAASYMYRLWQDKIGEDERWLSNGLLLAGALFAVIEAPIQLKNVWVTIAWTFEAMLLIVFGFLLKSPAVRVGGLIVFLLMAGRLLFYDTSLARASEFTFVLNDRFAAFLVAIMALYLAAVLYKSRSEQLEESEKSVSLALLLSANFFTLWILSAEAVSFFEAKIQALRTVEPATGVFPPSRPAVDHALIRNLEHAKNFSLSAIWAFYSILLVVAGIFRRVTALRIAGLVLFWITTFKVFAVDVFGIGGIYRVASLISLGVILVVTGYFYHRFSDRIKEFLTSADAKENSENKQANAASKP